MREFRITLKKPWQGECILIHEPTLGFSRRELQGCRILCGYCCATVPGLLGWEKYARCLYCCVHSVIAFEKPMTDWNHIMESTGSQKKKYYS